MGRGTAVGRVECRHLKKNKIISVLDQPDENAPWDESIMFLSPMDVLLVAIKLEKKLTAKSIAEFTRCSRMAKSRCSTCGPVGCV